MSCQSLSARAFAPESDNDTMTHCGAAHRSVRFSSESRNSREKHYDVDRRDGPGSISLTALVTPTSSAHMSQSLPSNSNSFDLAMPAPPVPCRFPKLEECAHFHYERVALGGLSVECVPWEGHCNDEWPPGEGWICLKVRSHVNSSSDDTVETRTLNTSWTEASDVREWTLSRNKDHFLQLDDMLHRCIYDRKVSGLPNLSEKITPSLLVECDDSEYNSLIADYVHHLSIIADDSINCGPVLNWLQCDNKGHKLLVANEDSSSINTPAVAAGYSVRKYVSQARDEISFEVGDMISIIDMPGPGESLWWRGKRGFRVGFFPRHCVAVIGDKVPRHMTQPPPIVGSLAMAPIKPVLRKHGKLISLFRSFILSRPSRRSLKQQGILRERVFGCDLGEHLLNCGHDVPLVLTECARFIESRGAVDGIYRLSGGSGLTQRLRAAFDEVGACPKDYSNIDPHALASLLKMYFRELPNPLCTYQLYESFVNAVQQPDEASKLRAVRDTVVKLPPPHYRTLAYLMRHLRRVSLLGEATGMTARNMAIVWAPNLLRSPRPAHALQGVAVQAVVTEFLICFAEELFAREQGADSDAHCSNTEQQLDSFVELRTTESCRRPKSLPLNPPTKLLSLEEARRRGAKSSAPLTVSPGCPLPPSGAIAAAKAANVQLRPQGNAKPQYIEVGSGPNNLPQYHTVLELPSKRGLKRSPSGWRGLFVRKHQRARDSAPPIVISEPVDAPMSTLRPVKSCESLASDTDTLAPLVERPESAPVKTHTRSSSCDSYFEPWAVELADMRLRLSPQERDRHMFSEEDDTNVAKNESLQSTPAGSCGDSVEPSPRRSLRLDVDAANLLAERRRAALEEQLASISYIDGDSPRAKPAEKRQCQRAASPPHSDIAKRLCKDRDSHLASPSDDLQTSLGNVKLRERSSPRKGKNSNRYSGLHPLNLDNVTINVKDGIASVSEISNIKEGSPESNDKDQTVKNDQSNTKVNEYANCQVTNVKPAVKARNVHTRLSWHGKDSSHSTLIKIDWPIENSVSNLTNLTTSSVTTPMTPVTPNYDTLESDSEQSEANKHTIKIESGSCQNCREEKCLKCELTDTDYGNVKVTDYENVEVTEYENVECRRETDLHDSLELSPLQTDISYQNLNRLSTVSTSSNSESDRKRDELTKIMTTSHDSSKLMTTSHDSSSTYSNISKNDDYENLKFTRPNYINLQSSSTSKSSPGSPTKSPLKSTISITFKSPTKCRSYENVEYTPTNDIDRDIVYENIDIEQNISMVEDASIPETDASLPTPACQPEFTNDLIILDDVAQTDLDKDRDVYSQVKFFRKSIDEVNAMIESPERESHSLQLETVYLTDDGISQQPQCHSLTLDCQSRALEKEPPMRSLSESPKNSTKSLPKISMTQPSTRKGERHYENVQFRGPNYENINVDTLKICDKNKDIGIRQTIDNDDSTKTTQALEKDNGNVIKTKNFNVKELATRFESPTEQTGMIFERFKAEIKYPSLERKVDESRMTGSLKSDTTFKIPKPNSPKTCKLSKNSSNARSLDENAFVKEFGADIGDRRKSLEVRDSQKQSKFTPDLNLNLNLEENEPNTENDMSQTESITPTTENKISLIQRFDQKPDIKNIIGVENEKKLSRERIEKYKEERRNFLREKYSSQSFRVNPEQLTRIKIKKDPENKVESERLKDLPKFERRNTVDLGQRMRFSLAKSANNIDTLPSPPSSKVSSRQEQKDVDVERRDSCAGRNRDQRKERSSPSFNIRDMAAIFELKSQSNNGS